MTNADRIRAMSDEELAEEITQVTKPAADTVHELRELQHLFEQKSRRCH